MPDYIFIAISAMLLMAGGVSGLLFFCAVIILFSSSGKKQENAIFGGIVCLVFSVMVLSIAAATWPT